MSTYIYVGGYTGMIITTLHTVHYTGMHLEFLDYKSHNSLWMCNYIS